MNAVRCRQCREILVSKHVHDFVRCGCANQTFIDGGDDYIRCGGVNMSLVKVLVERPDRAFLLRDTNTYGILDVFRNRDDAEEYAASFDDVEILEYVLR